MLTFRSPHYLLCCREWYVCTSVDCILTHHICCLAVIHAWRQTYLGDAHKILLQAVDDLHKLKADHNYAKIIPIIQSSGTGKSRTVDNIGTERILFPMCLREDLGKDLFGTSHASGTQMIDQTHLLQHILLPMFVSANTLGMRQPPLRN